MPIKFFHLFFIAALAVGTIHAQIELDKTCAACPRLKNDSLNLQPRKIRLNQVGYLPQDPNKAAFVANPAAAVFNVVEAATRKVVLSGPLKDVGRHVEGGMSVQSFYNSITPMDSMGRPHSEVHLHRADFSAVRTRSFVRGGLMFHSDQGCQYTSHKLIRFLGERGIVQSMSRRGQCWDNAPTESFFRTMKGETGIAKANLSGPGEVESVLFDWIETWYNLIRRHTFIGYCCPAEYEARWAA